MAIQTILIYPDDCLRQVAAKVEDPKADSIKALVQDLADTMYDAPGVGLAAPQIGVSLRLAVTDTDWKNGRYEEAEGAQGVRNLKVWINPEFIWKSEEMASYEEGCLSIPEYYEEVSRPAVVRLRWQDLSGAFFEQDFEGFQAVALQHEFDHLDGKLFIDYISPLKRNMITRKLKKHFK
ncbi:MAG: peptide deformylase [Zetaproteobacteria bacterium CG_4_9_14_3_um_filter_49_83]|nr:MAG: peptide deformylase [Zetaproteobacteria bacterium CG1_02_49_23]PIQ30467.1 MAG: peptide deformylase [Zetaproteobacteria bacterium CG17_big_fil_post_rev_8_21_14_2_50_50_13]PIV29084.1 MAG: peptide deformylase [Zetaproteobacteria bacterium CG02_land_8_20_14_3_00_50_9]PIY55249.1 MAG: peptide deformylase [Zetaproteobacteria bacterium CG_4_10_14_0_8_um_filter_49_80]PJA36061.1 MAG: peptide deformylase [Zetaproteobacteria bacterium CG_4_9_14_3_um_filter_49_83]